MRKFFISCLLIIGHVNLYLAAPHGAYAEKGFFRNGTNQETAPFNDRLSISGLKSGHDHDCAEDLFRQFPIFGGAPSADIAGRKDPLGNDPGIIEDDVRGGGFQRDRNIKPPPDAGYPSLLHPAGQHLRGFVGGQLQNLSDLADR